MIFLFILAQNQAKFLFANEKIYTVLSVLLLIWSGILIALWRIEKRLSKVEKTIEQIKQSGS